MTIFAAAATSALAAPAFDQYAPVAPGPEGDRHVSDGRLDSDHDALADAVRERLADQTGDPTLRPRKTSSHASSGTQPPAGENQVPKDRAAFAPAAGASLVDNLFSTLGLAIAVLVAFAVALIGRSRTRTGR